MWGIPPPQDQHRRNHPKCQTNKIEGWKYTSRVPQPNAEQRHLAGFLLEEFRPRTVVVLSQVRSDPEGQAFGTEHEDARVCHSLAQSLPTARDDDWPHHPSWQDAGPEHTPQSVPVRASSR